MRSFVLAEQFASHGWLVDFYSDLGHAPWVISLMRASRVNHISCALKSSPCFPFYDLVVLDTYSEENLRKTIQQHPESKIITVEDSSTPWVRSDFKVIQSLSNAYTPPNEGRKKSWVISGPRYLLVRKQIENVAVSNTLKSGNVIVLSGGSDQTDFAKSVYSAILNFDTDYSFHFIGLHLTSSAKVPQNVTLHPYGTRIEELKFPLSFAISLAGISAIELLAAKVPTILAASVENQFSNFRLLSAEGYVVPLACYDAELRWTFSAEELLSATEKLSKVRVFMDLDFEGAKRIYQEINEFLNESNS